MSNEAAISEKPPTLFRNYISFGGGVIAAGSLASIGLLILMDLLKTEENPYRDLVTFVLLPGFLTLGIVIILVGVMIERRHRRRRPDSDIARFPKIDLNDSRQRRIAVTLIAISFVFVFMSAFGSYRAFEYSESNEFCGKTCHSVMKPEFVAFHATSHAQIRCVDCHVGSGAESYVRAKLNGARQLVALTFNSYSRPIETPVHNMRPANETCGHCHWSAKFYGAELKTFNHYGYDEQNSLRQTRMLINVGGGNPETGPVAGIHWHMNLANEVSYISTDARRQVIPWISVKDRQGNVVEYYDRTRPLSPDQISTSERRRMDCIDCHNRPAHTYLPPDLAVDQAFAAGRMDMSLPYLKREVVASLTQPYATEDEAIKSVEARLDNFFRTNYSQVYGEKPTLIKNAIGETQRIYRTYFFPEMKTNWESHPNNLGHFYSSGCFRCHDGEHVSKTGKVISNDCNVCHTVLSDSARPQSVLKTIGVQHPVDLGGLADRKCESCHKANAPFKHPVDLGDISMFQCVECHPKSQ
ncbi:MAG TPA: NapC/NirT family cytochrome c [Pyrinomonadaceae bacterium]